MKYDEAERNVGIAAYVSPDALGFAAVSKARYSDFLVREVDVDGNVARLTSLENNLKEAEDSEGPDCGDKRGPEEAAQGASEESSTKKAKMEGGSSKETPNRDNGEKLKDAKTKLEPLVGEEAAKGAVAMLLSWEDQGSTDAAADGKPKNFTFPLIDDKDKRREIHQLIRSDTVAPFALADTIDKKVRIWHKQFEKEMPNYGAFVRDGRGGGGGRDNIRGNNKKKKWPTDRPNFLRFVLYKENIDTGTAVKEISRMLGSGGGGRGGGRGGRGGKGGRGRGSDSANVNYAGMKDKRGVTAQYCTVYRKTPDDLLRLNTFSSSRGSGCGGGSTGGAALMKVGHFSYVHDSMGLGSLGGNRFDLVLRNAWLDNGDGQDNNDRIAKTKAVLEKAALALQMNGFVNYFGMQRFGRYYDTHLVGLEVIRGNFEEVINIIMRPKSDENDRFTDARRRWQNRFEGVDMSDEDATHEAEKKAAQSVLRDLGRFMNCEVSLMHALSRRPRDYLRAFQSIAKNMRSMFVHAFQSYLFNRAASHRIEIGGKKGVMVGDLALIEDKSLAEGGSGTSGLKGKAVKVLNEADIKSGNYSIGDVVLPLAGTKIQYPENSTGAYYDEMLSEFGVVKDDLKTLSDRDISLPGDYRRLLCIPSDFDFEVKVYEDPLQPLLQTDLMKISAEKTTDEKSDSKAENGGKGGKEGEQEEKTVVSEKGDPERKKESQLIGMVVGFTLPPSSYATIALRELMKKPTSADYQKQLQVSGKCESTSEGDDNKATKSAEKKDQSPDASS